jgi:hypothetical protein
LNLTGSGSSKLYIRKKGTNLPSIGHISIIPNRSIADCPHKMSTFNFTQKIVDGKIRMAEKISKYFGLIFD